MKSTLSPGLVAVVIVLVVAAIGLIGWRFMGASPASSASEDLRPINVDLTKLKASDFDQVKKDLEAASARRTGESSAEKNAASGSTGTSN